MKKVISCVFIIGCVFTLLPGCATKTGSVSSVSEVTLEEVSVEEKEVILNMKTSEIQRALKNAGYYEAKVDGLPGPKTRDAIRRFQADNGLMADSIAGPKTQKLLIEHLDKDTSNVE